MKITLIRHPQTEANEKKIIYGTSDYPYTKKGHQQFDFVCDYIERNSDKLNHGHTNLKVISSPSLRTRQLADGIGHVLQVETETDYRIGEMNFGIFEGLTLEDAQHNYPKVYEDFRDRFDTTTIPDGESYASFRERIQLFLKEVALTTSEGTIDTDTDTHTHLILVSHGAVIREMIELLLCLSAGDSWKFMVGNGCIIHLDYVHGAFRLKELIASQP